MFAGTPAFAAAALQALITAGHDLVLVLTQPDRPAGRGLKIVSSDVKKIAQQQGLRVEQPLTLRGAEAEVMIAETRADAMVVAAYGLILPKAVLAMPRLGCINIHASLLPRWRGAAPIQRAILAGDRETGITIMQMDEGLDTGDMLVKRAIAIGADETAGELHDRLAALGAQLIVEALKNLPPPVKQDAALATYAAKITKDEAAIDWTAEATQVARAVRAYNPFPGAATAYQGERIKIWRARAVAGMGAPGTLCDSAPGVLRVACGVGALDVLELQRAGGKSLPAAAFLAGNPMPAGSRFGH